MRSRLIGVERRLDGLPGARAAVARSRAQAAYRLLSDAARQRAEADRLIARGLRPVTSELACVVNRGALARWVARTGPEADVMQYDKSGRPRGTLRELAQRFLTALRGRDEVRLRYRHSLLGAELVAAGFVVASLG